MTSQKISTLKYLSSLKFLLVLVGCISSPILFAKNINDDELTADEIVVKASLASYYGGNDGRTMARMKIVDANGRTQLRQFTILRKDVEEGGKQKFLVVFSRPTDVAGTVFMVHKKPGSQDDRWLYLPALDLVKRISAGDKRTSFVGAHYFYEDVSGRSPDEDKHELVMESEAFYQMRHTPKEPTSVEFSYYLTWIDKKTFLPVKIQYFDASNKATRLIEAVETINVQGIPTVVRAKVSNLTDGSYTLMEFKKMTYDLGIDEDVFTESALRNPPKKWLDFN
ncbi:outer membrane lipoprotein-sorting protein [Aliikangiella sp. G2MR2-5]|uniref:outer membrane lipoprotein-sorting protein n=1 Tax=Aliikangiella sp. G2MR2-5 TaxID=2788943 RepID=UPI0018AB2C5C|nr:outer membrane lipoprotein-sorting protein [Aliikangiella sp. G2MR2-5]